MNAGKNTRSFSLRSTFGTIAIIALVLALGASLWRLYTVETKLSMLASRFGVLQIRARKKFNVIAAKTDANFTYQWQIHVPDGDYRLRVGHGVMNPEEIPDPQSISIVGGLLLHPTEGIDGCLVSMRLRRSEGVWKVVLEESGKSVSATIARHESDTFDWIDKAQGVLMSSTGSMGTRVRSPNKPWMLLSLTESVMGKPRRYGTPTQCLMVWIEPDKDKD